ncbi:MAG: hypothetical protein JW984_04025 [Deltaproteobacteria bacterium]|uniref:Lipoprotein n=1 Tax=Candidatus Zymogenus saltonus TaxID=2844893 RepID=A0A9D8KBA8_9DELT|nr:hypothetical protein [Candidatus Zymogenus saltonus]
MVTAIFALSTSSVILSACATMSPAIGSGDLNKLKSAYIMAVADAETAEPSEISTNLVPIVETNKNLVWRGEPGKRELLVVTWTSWNGYDVLVGKKMVLTREIWVTTVPELKEFSRENRLGRLAPEALTLRLEGLMGLPPNNGKDRFVEIWVSPEDLFRPSPDPEVTDMEAELDFPGPKRLVTISKKHILWFNDLRSKSYGEGGYPWTRLGYTYDWGSKEGEVGLSEFVIMEGAEVTINSVTKTSDYCK